MHVRIRCSNENFRSLIAACSLEVYAQRWEEKAEEVGGKVTKEIDAKNKWKDVYVLQSWQAGLLSSTASTASAYVSSICLAVWYARV